MTEAERQELEHCRRRIAELLYQEDVERKQPLSTLGAIETTVLDEIQAYVSPNIGAFLRNRQWHHKRISSPDQPHSWTNHPLE